MPTARPVVMAVVGALTGLLLAGCGGDPTPTAAGGSATSSAAPAPTATPTAATGTTGPVTKEEFLTRFRDEPDLAGVAPQAVDCLAGLYVKYIRQDELRAYVNGTLSLDQFDDEDNPTAKRQMLSCVVVKPSGG